MTDCAIVIGYHNYYLFYFNNTIVIFKIHFCGVQNLIPTKQIHIMYNLIRDVLDCILDKLDEYDLSQLSLTCRELARLTKNHRLRLKYFTMWYEKVFGHRYYVRRSRLQYLGETPLGTTNTCIADHFCYSSDKIPLATEKRQELLNWSLAMKDNLGKIEDLLKDESTIFVKPRAIEIMYKFPANDFIGTLEYVVSTRDTTTNEFESCKYCTMGSHEGILTGVGLRNFDLDGVVSVYIPRMDLEIVPPTKVKNLRYDKAKDIYCVLDSFLHLQGDGCWYLLEVTYKGTRPDKERAAFCTSYVHNRRKARSYHANFRWDTITPYIDRTDEPTLKRIRRGDNWL